MPIFRLTLIFSQRMMIPDHETALPTVVRALYSGTESLPTGLHEA
jgi:hypothetical protein